MRIAAISVVALVGAVLGLMGAAAFNLAGLFWTSGSIGTTIYWDPRESGFIVFLGCLLMLGWAVCTVTVLLVSRVGVDPGEKTLMKRLGNILAGSGLFIVLLGLVLAFVVLPTQDAWTTY